MATRMLRIRITGFVSPPEGQRPAPRGDYLATEIRQPTAERSADLRAEPMTQWRLRRIDTDGHPLPEGPEFVVSFRDLANYIEAKHIRVVAGNFV